jgi:Derlin-2/3
MWWCWLPTFSYPTFHFLSDFSQPQILRVHIVVRCANTTAKLTCGFYLGGAFLLQPLILAFAYTFAQENPNANVNIFFITFPAKYLPLAILFVTMVLDGPRAAIEQVTGIIAAHLYEFLTRIWPTFGGGTNYITTPNFVKSWFVEPGPPRPQPRGYGTVYEPGQPAPAGNAGWSHQRGPGRRLGGD